MAIITASNSAIKLAYQKETEWGTVPGSEDVPQLVDYQSQKLSSGSFSLERNELEDDSISTSRGVTGVRYGNYNASGNISGNLSYGNFDDLMASACQNSWVGDVLLSDGITESSFTYEVQRPDVSIYEVWSGFQVSTMNVSSPSDGLTTVSFDLNGKTQEGTNSTAQDADVTNNPVYDALHHCGGVVMYDGNVVEVITSVDFTLENGLENQFAWGNCAAVDVTYGKSRVTGTLNMFLVDDSIQQDSLLENEVSLSFELVDPAGNKLKFEFPRVKIGSTDVPIEAEGPSTMSAPFTALYDETEQTSLKITRTPV